MFKPNRRFATMTIPANVVPFNFHPIRCQPPEHSLRLIPREIPYLTHATRFFSYCGPRPCGTERFAGPSSHHRPSWRAWKVSDSVRPLKAKSFCFFGTLHDLNRRATSVGLSPRQEKIGRSDFPSDPPRLPQVLVQERPETGDEADLSLLSPHSAD